MVESRPMNERRIEVGGTAYRLARIEVPDLAPLVPLFRQVYRRRDFTRDWLQKKYACEYNGMKAFVCVAFAEQGQAVASLGVLPWPIRFGDRTELAAQIVDGATHHDHRRRGLFARLAEMAVDRCRSSSVSFLFGFAQTQANSYPALIRYGGFTHVDDLVEYRVPIRTLWVERVARRLGGLDAIYARYVDRTLSACAPSDPILHNSLLSEGFAATDREKRFHEYKSFAGSRVLAVEGGRVWMKVRRGFNVGDLEASSESDMERTVCALEGLAARLGVHQILFQSSKDTRRSRFFAARFQPSPCLTVLYRNLDSQIRPEQLRFSLGDLDNF